LPLLIPRGWFFQRRFSTPDRHASFARSLEFASRKKTRQEILGAQFD
jgi:hypothetical protein